MLILEHLFYHPWWLWQLAGRRCFQPGFTSLEDTNNERDAKKPVRSHSAWDVSALSGVAANQSLPHIVGDAFGLQSNDLVYRETHCNSEDALSSEVFYQRNDGTLIAHKSLDYRSGHTTPSYVQHNIQAGEKIRVSFDQVASHGFVIASALDSLEMWSTSVPQACQWHAAGYCRPTHYLLFHHMEQVPSWSHP